MEIEEIIKEYDEELKELKRLNPGKGLLQGLMKEVVAIELKMQKKVNFREVDCCMNCKHPCQWATSYGICDKYMKVSIK